MCLGLIRSDLALNYVPPFTIRTSGPHLLHGIVRIAMSFHFRQSACVDRLADCKCLSIRFTRHKSSPQPILLNHPLRHGIREETKECHSFVSSRIPWHCRTVPWNHAYGLPTSRTRPMPRARTVKMRPKCRAAPGLIVSHTTEKSLAGMRSVRC